MSSESPDEYGSPPDYEDLCRAQDEVERIVREQEASKAKELEEKNKSDPPESPPSPLDLTNKFPPPEGNDTKKKKREEDSMPGPGQKRQCSRNELPAESPTVSGSISPEGVLSQDETEIVSRKPCPYCLQDPCDNQEDIDDTKQRLTMYFCTRVYDNDYDIPGNFQRRRVFKTIYKDIVVAKGRDVYARYIPPCVKAVSQEMYPTEKHQIIDFYGNVVRTK